MNGHKLGLQPAINQGRKEWKISWKIIDDFEGIDLSILSHQREKAPSSPINKEVCKSSRHTIRNNKGHKDVK